MKVIGTAGHVDHGKSTLVKALTGIDPDRLKEEKSREMTIELGFAWMELPDGQPVGIVDVPGHRDFIENMLAGVGGIDAVVFVIASDEGIMPQTREHLAILQLLGVSRGVIALTKTDLVDDQEWLSLVISDITTAVSSTFLKDAKIIPVSARTGSGIAELIQGISYELSKVPDRVDKEKPRLSVDRAFTIQGFGTVVTGTLINGKFITGDPVVILPEGIQSKIRGLQTHKQKISFAEPGSRLAINLSSINVEQIKRGDIITKEGLFYPSNRIDAYVQVLPDTKNSLTHNDEIKIFHLASESVGHIRILGSDSIRPGESGYVQIETVTPIVCDKKDSFIIRLPSPGETIGGGIVINPKAPRRYRRSSSEVIKKLMASHIGSIREKIVEAANSFLVFTIKDIFQKLDDDKDSIENEIKDLIHSMEIIELSPDKKILNGQQLISKENFQRILREAMTLLATYHQQFPLRYGIPREEFRNRMNLGKKEHQLVFEKLISGSQIASDEGIIKKKEHEIRFSPEQIIKLKGFWDDWERQRFSPPPLASVSQELGDELLNALLFSKDLIRVAPDVIFREKEIAEMRQFVEEHIQKNGKITVVEFRDKFNTSRKYALAFLEYLDSCKITTRDGDFRYLSKFNK